MSYLYHFYHEMKLKPMIEEPGPEFNLYFFLSYTCTSPFDIFVS